MCCVYTIRCTYVYLRYTYSYTNLFASFTCCKLYKIKHFILTTIHSQSKKKIQKKLNIQEEVSLCAKNTSNGLVHITTVTGDWIKKIISNSCEYFTVFFLPSLLKFPPVCRAMTRREMKENEEEINCERKIKSYEK